jgi:hypothetical protein
MSLEVRGKHMWISCSDDREDEVLSDDGIIDMPNMKSEDLKKVAEGPTHGVKG